MEQKMEILNIVWMRMVLQMVAQLLNFINLLSNYILARTILHEYYHAGDFYSGNAGMKMWSLRYKLNLKGNELQNAYTDYFERGAFNYVRGLGAYQDKNYYYNPKLYHR